MCIVDELSISEVEGISINVPSRSEEPTPAAQTPRYPTPTVDELCNPKLEELRPDLSKLFSFANCSRIDSNLYKLLRNMLQSTCNWKNLFYTFYYCR